ncbi:MAG: EAL domain-containing protein [Gammaproteobacteria bacterium]|nr:MAG: EAL domain-containing protein [Gammaproteobacteria bacterium]
MRNKVWPHHALTKFHAIVLTIVLAIVAIGTPIFFAVHQAQKQGMDAAKDRALLYAYDIMQRSDKTGDQIDLGIARLLADHQSEPCNDHALEVMREIDLNSMYIQAIGFVKDDTLVCNSLGIPGLALGQRSFTTNKQVSFRTDVQFSFAPKDRFIVVERDGFAAIIHKALPLDISLNDADVSLAIFSAYSKSALTSQGFIDPTWINRLGDKQENAFVDQGRVVALVHSKHYLTVAIATVPVSYADSQIEEVAHLLVPIGLLSGLVVVLAIIYLARVQLSLASLMKTALRRKEFFLLYQPIVDLRTGKFVGAEALIRWRRPVGEIINPDLFIPMAEKSGIIRNVTRYVLDTVAEDAQGLFGKHPDFHIAINLSHEDMQSHETAVLLQAMKKKLNAGPKNIQVEATERGLVDIALAKEVITEIHAQGIKIAIDDFGTGYSSLSYLQMLDLDSLKIDKSFIDTIGTEAVTGQVVDHIIKMSKDLKFEMIAEGVETETQAEFLRNHGVEYAQGWLFGKAMSMESLVEKLELQQNT